MKNDLRNYLFNKIIKLIKKRIGKLIGSDMQIYFGIKWPDFSQIFFLNYGFIILLIIFWTTKRRLTYNEIFCRGYKDLPVDKQCTINTSNT